MKLPVLSSLPLFALVVLSACGGGLEQDPSVVGEEIAQTEQEVGCAATVQLLSNPGFESGAVSWYQNAAIIDGSGAGSLARTGSWKAFIQGYGTSRNDQLGQVVTVPSNACTLVFRAWVKVTTTETGGFPFDSMTVRTLDNATSSIIETLATYTNLSVGTGYVLTSVSLPVATYRGRTIRLQFDGSEDISNATSFFVDDVRLTYTW